MIRNLKALGLALVAVFAMGAMAASSASAVATQDLITSSVADTYLTGVGSDNKFEITSPATNFRCTTSKFSGTFLGKSVKEVTVTPTYTGTINITPHTTDCTASIGSQATIDMNGCDYLLTGLTDAEHPKGSGKFDAQVHVKCPVGKEIEITNPVCNTFVPEQTPTEGGVTYTNGLDPTTALDDITIHATATGITWTAEDSFACTLGGLKENNNADYTGTVTVTGYEDAAHTKQVGITVS